MQFLNNTQSIITLPTGASTGTRIVIDGTNGTITAYYPDNNISWQLSTGAFSSITSFADNAGGNPTAALDLGQVSLTTPSGAETWTINADDIQSGPTVPGQLSLFHSVFGDAINLIDYGSASNNTGIAVVRNGLGWITVVPAVNFAVGSTASATYQALQYRVDNEDNVWFVGAIHATAALAAGGHQITTIGTYGTPKKNFNSNGVFHATAADGTVVDTIRLNINPATSNVTLVTSAAIGLNDNFYINVKFPLGNIL